MPTEDLKSRTPGALDDASRAFVDRVANRGEGIGGTSSDLNRPDDTADPDPEIDDTGLPLDQRSDGSVEDAATDLDDDRDSQPDSENPNDAGENEARPSDKTNDYVIKTPSDEVATPDTPT